MSTEKDRHKTQAKIELKEPKIVRERGMVSADIETVRHNAKVFLQDAREAWKKTKKLSASKNS